MLKLNHGFTLIEIIIVIAIMTLFLGAGMVSYNSFGQQKTLEKDAEMIRDKLSIIRERTIGSDISAVPGCDPFVGYKLQIRSLANEFRLLMTCGQPPSDTNINQSFGLENSVVVFPVLIADYTFSYPYACQTANCSTARNPNLIRIRNQNNTQCMDINIDNIGNTSFTKPYNGPC